MQIEPIDLTALISSILGISIVLIPVIGLTARFALQPVVNALKPMFDNRTIADTLEVLERRMALLEQQVESLDGSVRNLADVGDFNRALDSGDREEEARPEPLDE